MQKVAPGKARRNRAEDLGEGAFQCRIQIAHADRQA
jgi:hypothetical protein